MKQLIRISLFATIVFLNGCNVFSPRVLKSELKVEAGIIYYDSKPFSGVAFQMWDEKNVRLEITCNEGKINGNTKIYFKSGQVDEEISIKDNFKDGPNVKYFESNGNIEVQKNYKDGYLSGQCNIYFENGKLKSEFNYKDETNYTLKEYHANGNPAMQITYVDGSVEGKYEEYFENGKLRLQCEYQNGRPEGKYVEYDEDGRILIETYSPNDFNLIKARALGHAKKNMLGYFF